jgi:hypothetical protein
LVMKKLTIAELTELVMEQARDKGFGTKPEEINVAEKIALIQAQVSSGYEGYRKKKMVGQWSLGDEMAGAVMRIIHLCAVLNLDLEKTILSKIDENKTRVWNWDELNEKHT